VQPSAPSLDDCVNERNVLAGSSRRAQLAILVVGVVSLIVLAPVMGEVYSSLPTVIHASSGWVLLAIVCTTAGFVSSWSLQRLTLRAPRWYDVAGPQLAGNAASNVLPLGSAFGPVIQLRMLTRNRINLTRAVTGLTISGMLSTLAGLVLFPLLVLLPGGDAANSDVDTVARGGVIALLICLPLVLVVLRSDRPMKWVARTVHKTVRRIPRCRPPADLAERIVAERDSVRASLRHHKGLAVVSAAGRTLGDYFALYASLLAVGLHPSPTIVLVAFVAANAAGMIPFTPGGVGFVEAGLSGTLILTGAQEEQALAAVAIYRLISCWLPVLAGTVAYLTSRRPAVWCRQPSSSDDGEEIKPVVPATVMS
jgi:uncharacterized protein (TIRG00374 family)